MIDYSNVSTLRLMTEHSFTMMMEQYIMANMLTEQAARLGKENASPAAFRVALHNAAEAWDDFEVLKKHTMYLAEALQKQEEAAPQKTSLRFDGAPFFSHALAANVSAGDFQERIQRGYESAPMGWTVRDLAGKMGNVDGELARDVVRQAEKDRENWDNTANVNPEHVAAVGKVAKIGTGIALIPVGIGVGLVGASTGGVVAGVIGVTATMSGALSTAISVGEELSGKQLSGDNKTVKNVVDFVAVTSSGANLMCSLCGSGKSALEGLVNSGKKFTAKDFVTKWAKDFSEGNGTLGNILMVNDAKSANDFIKDLKQQGMDCVAGKTADGKPCIILKKVEKQEEVQPLKLSDISTDDLTKEIEAREKKIQDAKAQMHTILDESLDWEYKNSVGMTRAEYYKKCEELEKKIEKAQEEYDKAFDADDGSSPALYEEKEKARKKLHQAYQDWLDFTKPHSDYVNSQAYKDEAKRREDDFAKAEEDFEKAVQESADLNQKQAKNEQAKKIQESIANDKNAGNRTYPAASVAGTYMGKGYERDPYKSETWQESVIVTANGENSLIFTFHDYKHDDNPDWTREVAYDPVNGIGEIEGFPFRFTRNGSQYIFNYEYVVNVEGVHVSLKFGE